VRDTKNRASRPLRLLQDLFRTHQTLDALKKHLGPGEIVELIMAIGFWGMVARVLETTEVELEDFAGKVNLLDRSR
jgi:alkylhydroperoxidase family enzyme